MNTMQLRMRLTVLFFAIVAAFMLTGCGGIMRDMEISKYPLLETSIPQQSPPTGYSRLIVYSPTVPFGGLHVMKVVIENSDSTFSTDVLERTGFYIDLPAGDYQISSGVHGGLLLEMLEKTKVLHLSMSAEKTYAVKIDSDTITGGSKQPVFIADCDLAIKELRKEKVRFYSFGGLSYNMKNLPLKAALIPNTTASARWTSTAMPQNMDSSKARIYILNRTFIVGAAVRPSVGIDCMPDIEIDKTKYVCFEVNPGRHVFSHKTGVFTKSGATQPIGLAIDLKEGENYCMDFAPTKGMGIMPEKEAKKIINNKGKLAKDGYYCLRP